MITPKKIQQLAVTAGGRWVDGYKEDHLGDHIWQEQVYVDHTDMDLNMFAKFIVDEYKNSLNIKYE